MRNRIASLIVFATVAASTALAQSAPAWTPPDAATKELALSIFRQLIEINSTDSVGSVTAASKAMQQRFLDAGFPASDIFVGGSERPQREPRRPLSREPGRIRRSFSSGTKTSSKHIVRTGPPIRSSSSRRTATTTAAAPRT